MGSIKGKITRKPMGTMWGKPVEGLFRRGKEIGYAIEGEGSIHLYPRKRRK